LDEKFILMDSGDMTLRDLLIGLEVTANEFPTLDRRAVRSVLERYIGVAIRDEILAREAIKIGLLRSPNVRHDVDTWMDSRKAYLVMQKVADTVKVTEAEIADFYLMQRQSHAPLTEINIREILSETDSAARALKRRIVAGEDMPLLAREYSMRIEWRRTGGESGFFRFDEHPDLWSYAMAADSGKLVGPYRLKDGFTIFKVLAVGRKDDSVRARLQDARRAIDGELLEAKIKATLDQYISRLASEYGISKREGVLSQVHTTPTNMVVFRYIGFGGRINAAPFLMEQADWVFRWLRGIKLDQRKEPVL
jgi:hypothetical protein